MAKKLIILLLLVTGLCFGQKQQKPDGKAGKPVKEAKPVKEKKDPAIVKAEKMKRDSLKREEKKLKKLNKKLADTLYYQKYNASIIPAYYGSTKGYNLNMEQFMNKDTIGRSKINYVAESNWVDGVELSYDKLSVSFGYKSQPPKDKEKKGKTDYYNFGFNFGGNRWILEANYRTYKGFYEKNTGNYDTSFKRTGIYSKAQNLESSLYKLKFLYFTNHHKFAFKSCYSSSYRQIKTAATWIITANAYYNTLNSDSSIIPNPVRSFYQDYAYFKGLDVFAFSVYGGASVNLVMAKHIMMNATLMGGPEDQYRTYKYQNSGSYDLNYVYWSFDIRGSIGLNFDKFYTFVSFLGDITPYRSSKVEIKSNYYSVNFTFGARIHTRYPKFYRRFQNTKLYKLL
jgi:hypothetical protein